MKNDFTNLKTIDLKFFFFTYFGKRKIGDVTQGQRATRNFEGKGLEGSIKAPSRQLWSFQVK